MTATQRSSVDVIGTSDREALEKRFWEKVDKSGGADACWLWTAALEGGGYGQFRVGRKLIRASRLAFALTNKSIPAGMCVCHRCDNRRCCNPTHLFLGTNADNMADCKEKGRLKVPVLRGEGNGASKLTEADAREIVAEADKGVRSAELARRFGVTNDAVNRLVRGNTWGHVTGLRRAITNLTYQNVIDCEMSAEYADGLWWTLHHLDDPDERAVVVTCYLDESGTDDLSPTAVVGGIMLDREKFTWLGMAWERVLAKHHVAAPLHMKKFPTGMPVQDKRAFFSDLVTVINRHKILSIAATLTTADFESHLAGVFDKRKVMGVYGMCFLLVVAMNSRIATGLRGTRRTPFLMDTGNPYKHHVMLAHESAIEMQNAGIADWKLGALAFDTDTNIVALQAADVIAWAVRRQITNGFGEGLEPLEGLFNGDHISEAFSAGTMTELGDSIRAKINS
jgi:hypothetical protein